MRLTLTLIMVSVSTFLFSQEKSKSDYIKELMDKGYKYDIESFIEHCQHSDTAIVRLYLNSGMNRNALNSTRDKTPLLAAVLNDHDQVAMTKLLISEGASLTFTNQKKETPFMVSMVNPNLELTTYLLEQGVDVNETSVERMTPLHMALENIFEEDENSIAVVELLISKGARVEYEDWRKEGALHRSARNDLVQITKLLIESGSPVNVYSKSKKTPLMAAAELASGEMIDLLVESGADPSKLSEEGWTALDIAKQHGNEEAIAALSKY